MDLREDTCIFSCRVHKCQPALPAPLPTFSTCMQRFDSAEISILDSFAYRLKHCILDRPASVLASSFARPPAAVPVRYYTTSFQKRCPRVVAVFHRVLTCLRLACRMETAVGNSTCVLREVGVDECCLAHVNRRTDNRPHLSLASPRLVRDSCCKQGKRADIEV